MNNLITESSLVIIALVFIMFLNELRKLSKANTLIKTLLDSVNVLDSIQGTKFEEMGNAYKKSINISTPDGIKTNIPSINYFNDDNISKVHNLNLRMLDSASGTLVGLGLLGTFLGLTVGIAGFDSSDSSNIQQSIQNLLGGMSTAFSTSLLGMLFSLIYTTLDKSLRNKLHKKIYYFTENLDES